MIQVTKTFLPPIENYIQKLKEIWDSGWITNNGNKVVELESILKSKLKVQNLYFATNGTIVLQLAIKALKLKKEIITTPFSYVATINSILWENCTPIFVDIDNKSFCIDSKKIENAIGPNTEAILATHVFGTPCDIFEIDKIALKYNLKVIYDAAHSFGCELNGKSLLSFGNISTCSFHATKVFHTIEGGCICTNEEHLAKEIKYMRQFGHVYDDYYNIGINAKNSEFHAAMGLVNLEYFDINLELRKKCFEYYNNFLNGKIQTLKINQEGFKYNYSYYPILFENEKTLIDFENKLLNYGIQGRRYFYPSLNKLPYLFHASDCPISEDISNRIYCLPLFSDLDIKTQDIILSTLFNYI